MSFDVVKNIKVNQLHASIYKQLCVSGAVTLCNIPHEIRVKSVSTEGKSRHPSGCFESRMYILYIDLMH